MSKPFDISIYKNVPVGGKVRCKDVVGEVRDYEHSGKPRFVVAVGNNFYVWAVDACTVEPLEEVKNENPAGV